MYKRQPEYGLLLEQNRAGDVLIQVEADVDSEYDYELLGYITPKKMGQAYHCPVFNGLSKQTTSEQLMDLGTQLNIHGIVPMFHVVEMCIRDSFYMALKKKM